MIEIYTTKGEFLKIEQPQIRRKEKYLQYEKKRESTVLFYVENKLKEKNDFMQERILDIVTGDVVKPNLSRKEIFSGVIPVINITSLKVLIRDL